MLHEGIFAATHNAIPTLNDSVHRTRTLPTFFSLLVSSPFKSMLCKKTVVDRAVECEPYLQFSCDYVLDNIAQCHNCVAFTPDQKDGCEKGIVQQMRPPSCRGQLVVKFWFSEWEN